MHVVEQIHQFSRKPDDALKRNKLSIYFGTEMVRTYETILQKIRVQYKSWSFRTYAYNHQSFVAKYCTLRYGKNFY